MPSGQMPCKTQLPKFTTEEPHNLNSLLSILSYLQLAQIVVLLNCTGCFKKYKGVVETFGR